MKRFACLFAAIAVLLIINVARASPTMAGRLWRQYQPPAEDQLSQDYFDLVGKRPNFFLRVGETTALLHPDIHFLYVSGTKPDGEEVFIRFAPGFSDGWRLGYVLLLESELKTAERRKPNPHFIFENVAVVSAMSPTPIDYAGGKTVDAKIRVSLTDNLSVGVNAAGYQLDQGLNPIQRAGFGMTLDLKNGWKFDAEFSPLNFNPLIPKNQPIFTFGVRREF